MNQKDIEKIVSEFRESTYYISDEDVEDVLRLCRRKIEITNQSEDYMKLLLPDELKNHCFGMAVNITTIFKQMEKEELLCAQFAEAILV